MVDDQWIVESAVARALAPAEHVVVGVRSPEELAEKFTTDRDFQLAFIDLDFLHESTKSGLAALEECGKARVPAAVLTSDGEHNRILHLLAAFEFYPDTLTLLSKHGAEKDMRDIATAIAYGHHPPRPGAAARFRPPRRGPSWINSLVRRPGDLDLWRAAASYDRYSTIIQETKVGPRSLSTFLEQSAEAVHALQHEFFGAAPPGDKLKAGSRNKHLQVVTAFAQTYARFFSDKDVERLVNETWGTEGRQEGQGPAAAIRRRKPRTGLGK
ncbi:hypothetical protein [Streptomyces sp. ERV7]|uniref:hypothetical protein n=1 Tax=Streptomyces sp. ERV7 TaxID=1322334 RepID=UPI001F3B91BF|nr:hypothetical protein [Streptomyces sp. ERV7]